MTTRLATVRAELVTLIEAMSVDGEATKKYEHTGGRIDTTQTPFNAADLTFEITVVPAEGFGPEIGLQTEMPLFWVIRVRLCRARGTTLTIEEDIISNDSEKIITLLQESTNKGSATFVRFRNMVLEKVNDFNIIDIFFNVRIELSFGIS